MNLHPNTEGLKVRREQQAAAKAKNAKRIMEMIINSDGGLSVKEIAINMNLASATIREYIKDLIESGSIYAAGKEGKTVIYKVTEVADSKAEVPEVKEEIMPVGHSGKEFVPGSYIPVTDKCRPGDVIWISSRSGEGAFFRYLIITPWEHKAMVLGVFEEGYGKLDLNDPYYVFIGNDPETGKKLYADLRNNCQRGYKQFGERLMHVDQDSFDVVKCRLARSMGIDRMKVSEADPDVVRLLKKSNDRLKERISTLNKSYDSLKEQFSAINNKLSVGDKVTEDIRRDRDKAIDDCHTLEVRLKAATDELESVKADNKELTESYHAALLREEEARKGWDDSNRLAKDTVAERDKLCEELNALKADNEKLTAELVGTLRAAEPVKTTTPSEYDNDVVLGMVIDSKVKETKIEMLEDQIKMLRQMIFNMIKGGKDS